VVGTGTVLDEWLGGLPADGITLVQGPVGCGRTTFLQAVAEGVHAKGASVHWNGNERLTRPASFQVRTHSTLERLISHVASHPPSQDGIVVIDDAGSYPHDDPVLGPEAKRWATFVRRLTSWQVPVLLGARTRFLGPRATTGMGVAAKFSATLILELEPLARTEGGVVVETRILKSRRQQAGAMTRLWLRPGAERPLIFA